MRLIFLGASSLILTLSSGISPSFAQQPQTEQKSGRGDSRRLKAGPELAARLKHVFSARQEAVKLFKERRWMEAEVVLKDAINTDLFLYRTPASLYAHLAEAQYQQGNLPAALQSMKIAFLDERNNVGGNALFLARFAEIAERLGEAELVEPLWEKAFRSSQASNSDIEFAAKLAKTPNQRKALTLVAAGEEAGSLENKERQMELNLLAVRLDPRCAVAHLSLSRLMGITPEAMAHLEAASTYGSPSLKLFVKDKIETLSYYLFQQQKKSLSP